MGAFSSLAEKLQNTFQRLRGKGKLSEKDIQEAMREVRLALLEADVNYKVVKDFVAAVKERALGQEVMASLTPAQQVIKIVHEELTALMGGTQSKIALAAKPPTVVMLVGLQGSGKTTSAGKLAHYFRRQGRRPLLVACDVYRPAAIKQLEVLGSQHDIPVFSLGDRVSPVEIARQAIAHAQQHGNDVAILDTAGRLHINEELMQELQEIKAAVQPHEVLLVVDAMTGQDAVTVAESFHQAVGIDGVIMTKLDGDTRGGAALSVKAVTGRPIKFVGMGEKLDALEPFHPDRMASRILGMGDVLTLIEKAQATLDQEKAREMERKLRQQEFTLEDFLEQLRQVRSMGPLEDILGMLPGLGQMKKLKNIQVDEKELKRVEAIIQSMTPEERRNPDILNGSRKRRIALGSGTTVQDVNRVLKQFMEVRKMMKQLGEFSGAAKKGKKGFKFPLFR
ncbi:MAG TPA: signal recognition particle protein [Clostridia bacterium]|nr:signal recognition particle protein [Clostridia bacterium]